MLSNITHIYDPCGFIAPITVLDRLLVQLAWEFDLYLDHLLPVEMQDK